MWSVELVLRASEMCFAPSGPMPLLVSLRVMVKSECQRLLTVEKRACGGAPERLEGRVRLESLREVFCALLTELVVLEPVSEGEIRVSAAIDSRENGVRRRTRASGGPSSS